MRDGQEVTRLIRPRESEEIQRARSDRLRMSQRPVRVEIPTVKVTGYNAL